MEMNELYTSMILEQSRNPANRRTIDSGSVNEYGHNPSCGDEITLYLKVSEGIVEDMSYDGNGCAISQASTSMMIDLLRGKSLDDVKRLSELFLQMARGEITEEEALEPLEDTAIFETVKNLPARVKCATLPWHTVRTMIEKGEKEGAFHSPHTCGL